MPVKKPTIANTWTDPDDAPPLSKAYFAHAKLFDGQTLKRRGRPKALVAKEAVKIRLDADVLKALRDSGDGWQTRINDTLRASLALAGRLLV